MADEKRTNWGGKDKGIEVVEELFNQYFLQIMNSFSYATTGSGELQIWSYELEFSDPACGNSF
jgi:hypothetical protein